MMSERILVILAVAIGGASGSLARFALSAWAIRRYPLGTFVANVVGCLLIGLIIGSLQHRDWLTPAGRHLLVTGFLGGLTTFSTFGYQSVALFIEGDMGVAMLNVATNLIVGFAAVYLGLWIAAYIAPQVR